MIEVCSTLLTIKADANATDVVSTSEQQELEFTFTSLLFDAMNELEIRVCNAGFWSR